jgi:hypothetical protein
VVWSVSVTENPTTVTVSADTVVVASSIDSTFAIVDEADTTKKLMFSVGGQATGSTLTVTLPALTASRTLNLPLITGTDTLASLGLAQTFTARQTVNLNAGALPDVISPADTLIHVGGLEGTPNRILIDSFAGSPTLSGRRANGTNAARTGAVDGNVLMGVEGRGYTSAGDYSSGARASIQLQSAETWSATNQGTRILFACTPLASTSLATAFTLTSAGATFATGVGVTISGLNTGRLPLVTTAGLITDSAKHLWGTNSITVGDATAADVYFLVNGASGNEAGFGIKSGGNNRWLFRKSTTAESGSDAGSNFSLIAYTDAGSIIDTPIQINRIAGGTITLGSGSTTRVVSIPCTTASNSTATGALLCSGGGAFLGSVYSGTGFGIQATTAVGYVVTIASDTAGTAGQNVWQRCRNTIASPQVVQSGDQLGSLSFRGYDGSSYTGSKAFISVVANEAWVAGSNNGTAMTFQVTPNSSTTLTTQLTLTGLSATFASTAIVNVQNTTASSSSTTGALIVTGGAGVLGASVFGNSLTVTRSNTDGTASFFGTGTTTIAGGLSDGYAAGIQITPTYSAATALTVTRHHYFNLGNPTLSGVGPAALTDACLFRAGAAAGTHKMVDSATTKTTPGGVDAWVKININGVVFYMPAYTSKTA